MPSYQFASYRLDPEQRLLTRDAQPVSLRAKTFDVLVHLVEHAGELVPAEELHETVWHGLSVSSGVLRASISELRKLLGDNGDKPVFIETVHGRGVRFIGAVQSPDTERAARHPFVGRQMELGILQSFLKRAVKGRRRIVLVTGDAGLGKTALVNELAASIRRSPALRSGCRIGYGVCLREAGDAWLPIVEALNAVLRQGPKSLASVPARVAPQWAPLLTAGEPADEAAAAHMTPFRMQRQGVRLIEAIAREIPLVLVLEDLHWADPSTLGLIEMLGARDPALPLLLIATCRCFEPSAVEQVRRLLLMRRTGSVDEVALAPLNAEEQREYLRRRFDEEVAVRCAPCVERWSAGNPLLLGLIAEDVERRDFDRPVGACCENGGRAGPEDVPPGAAALVEHRLCDFSAAEVRLLETASVCGERFSAILLADLLEEHADEVEKLCRKLAESSPFLDRSGRSERFGVSAELYELSHALYRSCLYERMLPERRNRLHGRLAEIIERESGGGTFETAAQLAVHFQAAGRFERAVQNREMAAFNEIRRHAHREAAEHARIGAELIAAFPPGPARWEREARLQQMLGHLTASCSGFSNPEVRDAHGRAQACFEALGNLSGVIDSVLAQATSYLAAGEAKRARELTSRAAELAESHCPELRSRVYAPHTTSLLTCGIPLVEASECVHRSLDLEPGPSPPGAADTRVNAYTQLVLLHVLRGSFNEAHAAREHMLERARQLGGGIHLATALCHAALAAWIERDITSLAKLVDEALAVQNRFGFPSFGNATRVLQAALEHDRDPCASTLDAMRGAFADYAANGDRAYEAYLFAMIAAGALELGDLDRAAVALHEGRAAADERGGHWSDAELLRIGAEIMLARSAGPAGQPRGLARRRGAAVDDPEAQLRAAAETAGRQGARLWELRAVTSLTRLLYGGGRVREGKHLLGELLETFRDQPETPDVAAARDVHRRLSQRDRLRVTR